MLKTYQYLLDVVIAFYLKATEDFLILTVRTAIVGLVLIQMT